MWWFSPRISKEEINDYLINVSKHELSNILVCVVMEKFLTDKGMKLAAEGRKILKRHQNIFRDCRSGADVSSLVDGIVRKWPEVSSEEFALLSDLVKAHKSLQRDAQSDKAATK